MIERENRSDPSGAEAQSSVVLHLGFAVQGTSATQKLPTLVRGKSRNKQRDMLACCNSC